MNQNVEIIVMDRDGVWSVSCSALGVSGFGQSREAALVAFKKSMVSTLSGRFDAAASQVTERPKLRMVRFSIGDDSPTVVASRAEDVQEACCEPATA